VAGNEISGGKGPELNLPGGQIERAVANVAEDGGKTLTSALRTLLSAWADRKAAVNVATAEQIRLDIADDAARVRDRKAIAERRQNELDEIDHGQALLERARGRVLLDIAHTQEAIEYVGRKAIEYNASDPDKLGERDIEQDWLRRFFRYVAEVDEATVLEIFAKALSEAAIRERPLLSPKALDTLRFFELYSIEMFEFCANSIAMFGAAPRGFLERRAVREKRELDVGLMIEMGLIKYEGRSFHSTTIGGFELSLHYTPGHREQMESVQLTHVGRSIAGLRNKDHRLIRQALDYQGSKEALLALQQALGISEDVVGDLALSLVADLAGTGALEIQVRVDRVQRSLSKKDAFAAPFGIADNIDLQGLGAENRALAERLLAEFDHFDKNQLDAMRDQPAIYPDPPSADAAYPSG
jgi:hypothetical protein